MLIRPSSRRSVKKRVPNSGGSGSARSTVRPRHRAAERHPVEAGQDQADGARFKESTHQKTVADLGAGHARNFGRTRRGNGLHSG